MFSAQNPDSTSSVRVSEADRSDARTRTDHTPTNVSAHTSGGLLGPVYSLEGEVREGTGRCGGSGRLKHECDVVKT